MIFPSSLRIVCLLAASLPLFSQEASHSTPPKDGLVLHLDATALPAGELQTWNDESGKEHHAHAKEKKPQRLAGTPALVRFDESPLSLSGPFVEKRDITVFAVVRRTAEQTGGKSWQRLFGDATPGKKDDGRNRLRLSAPAERGSPDAFPLAVMTKNFRDVEPGAFYIGGGPGSPALRADVGELLVYAHAFSDPTGYEQVVNYLCRKWRVNVIPGRDGWERFGPTPEAVKAMSKELPLIDQTNRDQWQGVPALSDEFGGESLDAAKWWDHNPGWYGRPPAPYLPENVAMKDGELQLTVKKDDSLESFTRYPNQEKPYSGYSAASVTSRSVMAYGCYEIRAKVAHFGGTSAWWFAGQSKNAAGEIHKTEIDVFELPAGAPGHEHRFGMNMHVFRRGEDHTHLANYANWEAPFRWSGDFHTFNLVWSPEWIRYYVDGHMVRTARNTDWHHPLQMVFDMEIMSWLPFPAAEQFPATFRVDYIRTWTRADWPQPTGWTQTSDPAKESKVTKDVRNRFR
jgi:beta-glucanase (GH16 family)